MQQIVWWWQSSSESIDFWCALGQGAAPGGGGGSGRALAPGVLDCVFVRTQRTHGTKMI